MKIGIVCPYNIFLPGGVQEHVKHQAIRLRERGHEVVILTPQPRDYDQPEPEGVIFLGQSTRVRTPQQTSMDVSVSVDTVAIDEVLAAEEFDILHFHEPLVPFMARQVLSRTHIPTVGTFHAAVPENVLGKSIAGSAVPYIRSIIKYLDALTAVSPAAAGYIEEVRDMPISYIPNGIDLRTYEVSKQQRDSDSILYIGRLEKRKGVRYLIEAFALLRSTRQETKLIIAGDGPERTMLETMATELGVGESVQFKGFVDDETKQQLLAECGLFCSPAVHGESFGIVLLEAMATGAVVVAGANAGYEWLLRERGRISLVNPKDTADFSRRLGLLLDDKELRALFGSWAKEYIGQYDYEVVVDAYETLYKKLKASRG